MDLLRIFACCAVVGLHTLRSNVSIYNSILYYLCGFAIPVFFMSSGYILVNRKEIPFSYIRKKVFSILSIVLLWNGLLFVLKFGYKVILHHDHSFHVYDFFLMTGKSLIQKDTMYHFWYLGALILIYLFLYCLSAMKASTRTKVIIWAIILGVSLVLQWISYADGSPLQKNLRQTFRLWSWVQYFLLGGMMPRIQIWINKKLTEKLHLVSLVLITAIIPVYQYLLGNYVLDDPHAEYFYDDILTVIWVILLFTFVMRKKLSDSAQKKIAYISPYTMGIYIVHPLFIAAADHFLKLNNFIVCFCAFIVILPVSFLVVLIAMRIPYVNKMVKL